MKASAGLSAVWVSRPVSVGAPRGPACLADAPRDQGCSGCRLFVVMTRRPHCQNTRWIIVERVKSLLGVPGPFKPRGTTRPAQAGVPGRAEAERAAQLAESALDRCVFLGDSLEVPERVEILHMRGSAHELGSLTWFDSRGKAEFGVNWSDLIALEVRPVDSPGQEIAANRRSLATPFGWFGRQRARGAVLCVRATWGQAELLVEGHTPAELDVALAPLRACIVRPAVVLLTLNPPPLNER